MQNYIILLDGSKGAGKSTTASLLREKISDNILLSLDEIRRSIPNAIATAEYNQLAYDKLLQQAESSIKEGKNIIIDCGLTEQKLQVLEEMVERMQVPLHKYFLEAPYDVLIQRVKECNIVENKTTDNNRIKYVHKVVNAKIFTNYTILDTNTLSTQDIVEKIIENTQ